MLPVVERMEFETVYRIVETLFLLLALSSGRLLSKSVACLCTRPQLIQYTYISYVKLTFVQRNSDYHPSGCAVGYKL